MTNERMVEFLLLKDFVQGRIEYNTTQYDKRQLKKRFIELKEEFLKPYAISNTLTGLQSCRTDNK